MGSHGWGKPQASPIMAARNAQTIIAQRLMRVVRAGSARRHQRTRRKSVPKAAR